jgi:hypothetical protein
MEDVMQRISLSPNFFLDEFTRSQTAERFGHPIEVELGSTVFNNLQFLCLTLLQPIREALGPITISSGYRPKWLNDHIGGSPSSDHLTGLAADIIVPGRNPLDVARFISSQNLGYKQLINEHDRWVHIASPGPDTMPRRQELTIWHNGQQNLTTNGLHSVTELREQALRG